MSRGINGGCTVPVLPSDTKLGEMPAGVGSTPSENTDDNEHG
jgi:hypothetical protein